MITDLSTMSISLRAVWTTQLEPCQQSSSRSMTSSSKKQSAVDPLHTEHKYCSHHELSPAATEQLSSNEHLCGRPEASQAQLLELYQTKPDRCKLQSCLERQLRCHRLTCLREIAAPGSRACRNIDNPGHGFAPNPGPKPKPKIKNYSFSYGPELEIS